MHDISLGQSLTYSLPPVLLGRVTHLKDLGTVTSETLAYHIYSDLALLCKNENHMVLDGGVEVSKDGFATTGGRHHTTGNVHGTVVIIWHDHRGRRHSRTERF